MLHKIGACNTVCTNVAFFSLKVCYRISVSECVSGLIENVAQTCAARIGYINKYILKKDIQIGFIGAVRNMDIVCLPKVGTDITTEIVVQEEVLGITLATATVTSQGIKLATAEIKIAIKEEWQQS